MIDEMEDDVVEEPFEEEDELDFNEKIEGLRQASRKRKYHIRREIEEAAEKRRFKDLFDDFDD